MPPAQRAESPAASHQREVGGEPRTGRPIAAPNRRQAPAPTARGAEQHTRSALVAAKATLTRPPAVAAERGNRRSPSPTAKNRRDIRAQGIAAKGSGAAGIPRQHRVRSRKAQIDSARTPAAARLLPPRIHERHLHRRAPTPQPARDRIAEAPRSQEHPPAGERALRRPRAPVFELARPPAAALSARLPRNRPSFILRSSPCRG